MSSAVIHETNKSSIGSEAWRPWLRTESKHITKRATVGADGQDSGCLMEWTILQATEQQLHLSIYVKMRMLSSMNVPVAWTESCP